MDQGLDQVWRHGIITESVIARCGVSRLASSVVLQLHCVWCAHRKLLVGGSSGDLIMVRFQRYEAFARNVGGDGST